MSDYSPYAPEPIRPSSGRRRTAVVAVLAAALALATALTLLLVNAGSHGSPAAAGQPTTSTQTSQAPTVATTSSGGPSTTPVVDGGGTDPGSRSSGTTSGGPSGGHTIPRVLTPALELHAFPTGPPSVDESGCPAHLSFATAISVNRGPVVVTYRWIRSDGGRSPVSSVTFTGSGPGLQTVFATWDLGGDYNGSQQLQVLTPVATTAAAMPFSVHCAPTVTIASVSASPAAGTCDSLATTLHAVVRIARSPVQVRYHWVVDGHAYPTQALPGTAVADQTIRDPFTLSTSVHGRSLHPVRLVIDSPYPLTSGISYLEADCA